MVLLRKQLSTGLKKNQLEDLSADEVLIDPLPEDILELDEMWSFVYSKVNKAWLWFAICRRTQQLVGWHLGKRDQVSANYFFVEIPSKYSICRSRSDPWHCYECLPQEKHRIGQKGTGETSYIEGFNNIIRQRLGRFVRKTCSFSKKWDNHFEVIKWFIREYNLERKSAMISHYRKA